MPDEMDHEQVYKDYLKNCASIFGLDVYNVSQDSFRDFLNNYNRKHYYELPMDENGEDRNYGNFHVYFLAHALMYFYEYSSNMNNLNIHKLMLYKRFVFNYFNKDHKVNGLKNTTDLIVDKELKELFIGL